VPISFSFLFFFIAHAFLARTLGKRSHIFCGIFIFMDEWMDGMFANLRCGNLAYGNGLYMFLIMRVRKETHNGQNNLIKLNKITSSMCV
jgi:hypothetical protein